MQPEDLKMKEQHIFSKEEKIEWFGKGEWADEPDLVEFDYKGFLCKVLRTLESSGHLCGYVSIPFDHPSYNIDYDDIDLEVHGGLTFSQLFSDNSYWIGFDCAHSGDCCPSIEKFKKESDFERYPIPEQYKHFSMFNPTYKNINYCIEECKKMVEQLILIGKNESTTTISR